MIHDRNTLHFSVRFLACILLIVLLVGGPNTTVACDTQAAVAQGRSYAEIDGYFAWNFYMNLIHAEEET